MNRARGSKILKILIGVIVAGVFVFIFAISAIISLIINLEFYQNRLGLNWWTYFTMDNAAILWCPIVTIIIMAIIVTCLNPTTSTTLTLVRSAIHKGYRKPSRLKCVLWNYIVIAGLGGLGMGWFIGFMTNAGFGIFVAKEANLSYNFMTFINALSYPLNPGVADMNVVFAFSFILRPFIILGVLCIMIKLGLDLLIAFSFRRGYGANAFKVSGTIALEIAMCFFIVWLYLPSGAYDVVDSVAANSVILGFFASFIIGLVFYLIGLFNPEKFRDENLYKKVIALALIVLFIIPIGALIAAGVKSLYREANWNTWVWDTKISTQIEKTRTAAGIDEFRELTTQQLMDNQSFSGTTDVEIIPHIRTYDYQASRASMENQIGTLWETLADSDIIYLNRSEYWTAPRTIRSDLELNWVNDHLIYTHSRGFVALNPVTGELIPTGSYKTVFGVPYDYPIYFGELPDNGYTMLNQSHLVQEIGNITYQGAPDVTLSGFLNWWYIEEWGFKTGNPTNYLVKRNIFDRIGDILLPYMIMGDDPYLVFDGNNKKMYYCVDIILDFPAFSAYIQSDIVRWLGVVLVDTCLGTMDFYYYNRTFQNFPYEFLNIYSKMYNWQPMPSWLTVQLKYPEILNEYQLEIDYTYHVTDPNIWRSGSDFFERPPATDLHHIMYDIGYGLTYVGASFVEFKGAEVGNLVGFYIIENGEFVDKLGRVTFYRNGTLGQTQMIGLSAARAAYEQEDAQFLQLLPNKRFGNYLIYPLAGSLYFVIPVYETTGTGKETLKRVALVNCFDPNDIGIGNSTMEAYDSLNITAEIPEGVLSLNVIRAPAISKANTYSGTSNNLELLINNGFTNQGFDVTLNISTQSQYFNVSFGGQELTPNFDGQNYTYFIANFSLLPTQYVGIIPQITGRLPAGSPSMTIEYYIDLYFSNGTLYDRKTRTIYIYQ
ncbi:MAG: UPF0182 family protein [Candidatus Helarchaeota archaeon]